MCPYIDRALRADVDRTGPATVGELTFVLYRECVRYLPEDARYVDFAEALAALEAAKLEMYRKVIAPYEDRKIIEHGDVS